MVRAGAGGATRAVRRQIDRGEIPPVWFWPGPETFLKEELYKRLVARLIDPALASMNTARFRVGETGVKTADALAEAAMIPMLGDRRVVLLSDVQKAGAKDLELLAAYARSPSPQTALVLWGEWGDGYPETRAESATVAALRAAGASVAVFASPGDDQKVEWIRLRFREAGKECPETAAHALLEACRSAEDRSPPLWSIAPEIEKVLLTVGTRDEVEERDLAVIGRRADEDQLLEIERMMDARDLSGALRAMDGALLFRDNTEVRVIARLAYLFAKKLRGRDRLYAPPEVRRALRRLAAADRALKSSGRDKRAVLERTVAGICRG